MLNKAGKTVAPTIEAFQAAAANADWSKAPGFYLILSNQPGDKSWPMTAATFILMYKKPVDVTASNEALEVLHLVATTRAPSRPRRSTTSRCPTTSSRSSRPIGPRTSRRSERRGSGAASPWARLLVFAHTD